jgi:ribosomal protein L1
MSRSRELEEEATMPKDTHKPGLVITCGDEDQRDELRGAIAELLREDEQLEHDRRFKSVEVQRAVATSDGFGRVIFDSRDAR